MNFSSVNQTAMNVLPTGLIEKLGHTTISILIATFVINIFLNVPTNGYIMKLILSENMEKVSSEIFQLNMSATELLSIVWGILFILQMFWPSSSLDGAFFFCCGMFFTSRPLFQCCICVEQYLAVVRPLLFLRCKPLRYRVTCCVATWLATLPLAVVCTTLGLGKIFFCIVGFQCSGFLAVISHCCASVLKVLKRPRPGQGEEGSVGNRNRKAFRYIRIHLLYTFFTQTPMLVASVFYHTLTQATLYKGVAWFFSFYVLSGCVPSVVYPGGHAKMRLPSKLHSIGWHASKLAPQPVHETQLRAAF